jgi:2-oxoglutarate ferredoxin oxidoreductase subunit delta
MSEVREEVREVEEVKERKKPKGIVYIIEERCKGCGFCIEFCPLKVLEFAEHFNPKGYHPPRLIDADKCNGCDLCGMLCPDFAIWAVRIK